jgi:hypothetical protein
MCGGGVAAFELRIRIVVGVGLRGGFELGFDEVGTHAGGIDQYDANTERCYLGAQRQRERLDAILDNVIRAGSGAGEPSAGAADDDDSARFALTHSGQDEP